MCDMCRPEDDQTKIEVEASKGTVPPEEHAGCIGDGCPSVDALSELVSDPPIVRSLLNSFINLSSMTEDEGRAFIAGLLASVMVPIDAVHLVNHIFEELGRVDGPAYFEQHGLQYQLTCVSLVSGALPCTVEAQAPGRDATGTTEEEDVTPSGDR